MALHLSLPPVVERLRVAGIRTANRARARLPPGLPLADEPNSVSATPGVRTRSESITAAVWFALAIAIFLTRVDARATTASTAALLLFGLLIGATLSLSVAAWCGRLRALAIAPIARLLIAPVAIALAILVYSAVIGLAVLPRAAAYGAYLIVPALIAGLRAAGEPSPVRVLAAALWLWLPIEFSLLPAVPLPPSGGLPAAPLAALLDGLYVFLIACPIERLGYTFVLTRRDAALALGATVAFAVAGIPIGIGTHFLAWHPRVTLVSATLAPFAIYLATAVPEEFLFRGLIQNSLERLVGRAGLPVAAAVFGLAHLPDPRYVCLAALAGLAYGWVYVRTRRITASAVTHALVDWIWVLLFRAR